MTAHFLALYETPADPEAHASAPAPRRTAASGLKGDTGLVNLLRGAVEAASDDDGWAHLGTVGSLISKQQPDFDSRSYGYGKLGDLVMATTLFEIDRRSPGDGKPEVTYVRDKRRRNGT